jgi:hypothetical protein
MYFDFGPIANKSDQITLLLKQKIEFEVVIAQWYIALNRGISKVLQQLPALYRAYQNNS